MHINMDLLKTKIKELVSFCIIAPVPDSNSLYEIFTVDYKIKLDSGSQGPRLTVKVDLVNEDVYLQTCNPIDQKIGRANDEESLAKLIREQMTE